MSLFGRIIIIIIIKANCKMQRFGNTFEIFHRVLSLSIFLWYSQIFDVFRYSRYSRYSYKVYSYRRACTATISYLIHPYFHPLIWISLTSFPSHLTNDILTLARFWQLSLLFFAASFLRILKSEAGMIYFQEKAWD